MDYRINSRRSVIDLGFCGKYHVGTKRQELFGLVIKYAVVDWNQVWVTTAGYYRSH